MQLEFSGMIAFLRRFGFGFAAPAKAGHKRRAVALPRTGDASQGAALFRAAPELHGTQDGYLQVLERLRSNEPYCFCKINHGFWERFARLAGLGVSPDAALARPGREIDDLLGIGGSEFAEGGLLAELVAQIRALPAPASGLHFVASLEPYPLSDRLEGTPMEKRQACDEIIALLVPKAHRQNAKALGYTGHEIKHAAITGELGQLLGMLPQRDVVFVGNPSNRALFDALHLPHCEVIEVDAEQARLSRGAIAERVEAALQRRQAGTRLPLLIVAAGGSLSTWLVLHAWAKGLRFQSIDVGGMLGGYSLPTAGRQMWTQMYGRQIVGSFAKMGVSLPDVESAYFHEYGLRDPELVALACEAGVAAPASCDEIATPLNEREVAFIENKAYDHSRMGELLQLSVAANHHANGGPVTALLERMVAKKLGLPAHRRVIALNNGTAALHLAADMHRHAAGGRPLRWVTSAFSFFSVNCGPLGDSLVIDSDRDGRFSLDALRALPAGAYDGVIYTNVFAQQADWDDVAAFCRENGKAFVVDNATGLLDRPPSAFGRGAPIETISAHHTKPWGVGEGGFVLCDESEEELLRNLINFGARLPAAAAPFASNYKISDLSSAAIIDRLERMPFWSRFYRQQERRMLSLSIDADCGIVPFAQTTVPLSPRAHSAFVAHGTADVGRIRGRIVLRKYYRPLVQTDGKGIPTPNATDLYRRCFSLSNAPEMRLLDNDEIVAAFQTIAREA